MDPHAIKSPYFFFLSKNIFLFSFEGKINFITMKTSSVAVVAVVVFIVLMPFILPFTEAWNADCIANCLRKNCGDRNDDLYYSECRDDCNYRCSGEKNISYLNK